jgi:hypothetical protein
MDVIEKARKRLAAVDVEMRKLAAEAERLKDFIRIAEALGRDGEVPTPSPRRKKAEVQSGAKPPEIIAAAVATVMEAQRPVPRSELLRLLSEQGVEVPGEDPIKNLSTILWRSDEITNIRGVGYWVPALGEWPHK